MKLFTIIEKNFKIFIRSKISALIILLGPLLLVSLIGMSFSNSRLPGLNVGLYSPSYNEFTNSIIAKIEENKFNIEKFEAKEACSDSVKKGESSICLVFPENMDKLNNEVTFIVDYSKLNLVWIVVDIFTTKVSERATELRTSYANDLLNRVIQTKDDLNKGKTDITSIGTKQEAAKTSASSAISLIDEININTDFGEDVSVSDAKSSLSTVTSKINSAKSKITSSKNAVSSSGLSDDEKTVITSDLSSASSSLNAALTYLEGNQSVKSLEYMILSLNSALENAKSQLEQIKQKKTGIKGDLIMIDGSITDSIKAASDLTASVENMAARLQNVQSSDAEQIISPIKTKIEPVTTPETHFNYLFPTLIVLVIMITSILLSSTLVMIEKKSKSVFRNFITPTSDAVFNLGTFVTSFIVIIFQLAVFLLISGLFFETDIISSLGSSVFILLFISAAFILLGMFIGYLFKSEETYVLASITVSALLLFLSSTVMPLESISDSVRIFASYTPFVISENLLRQVMFFHFNLSSLGLELLTLAIYIMLFYGLMVASQKLTRGQLSIKKKEEKK